MKNIQKHYNIYLVKLCGVPCYVGRTVLSPQDRLLNHQSHTTSALFDAIQKYGLDAFEVKLIDSAECTIDANEKEVFWTLFYGERYELFNKTVGTELTELARKKSVEASRKRRGTKQTEEQKVNISKSNAGKSKNFSKETIENMKKANKLRYANLKEKKFDHNFIVYAVKYFSKMIFIGICTNRMPQKEIKKRCVRKSIANAIGQNYHDKDLEVICLDHDLNKDSALLKEEFWKKFFSLDISSNLTWGEKGAESARKKNLGTCFSEERKKKISDGHKRKITRFDTHSSVMIVNLFLTQFFI